MGAPNQHRHRRQLAHLDMTRHILPLCRRSHQASQVGEVAARQGTPQLLPNRHGLGGPQLEPPVHKDGERDTDASTKQMGLLRTDRFADRAFSCLLCSGVAHREARSRSSPILCVFVGAASTVEAVGHAAAASLLDMAFLPRGSC